jgi:Ca2+-binding EF-hand superfamily protein
MKKTLLVAAVALVSPAVAAAQGAQSPRQVTRNDYLKAVDGRFSQIDTNHDGKITREELAAELQREVQVANARIAQQLQAKFKQLDTNHDGQLSLQEFMAAQPAIHPSETPEQMLERLDKNHDGRLTQDEFRAPEIIKFDRLDANHDGVVTPAEIQAANGRK